MRFIQIVILTSVLAHGGCNQPSLPRPAIVTDSTSILELRNNDRFEISQQVDGPSEPRKSALAHLTITNNSDTPDRVLQYLTPYFSIVRKGGGIQPTNAAGRSDDHQTISGSAKFVDYMPHEQKKFDIPIPGTEFQSPGIYYVDTKFYIISEKCHQEALLAETVVKVLAQGKKGVEG